jgi:hypothetical protein
MIDPISPEPRPSSAASLEYESPQTRRDSQRPPPPHTVGRLWAVAAVIFAGAFVMHASLHDSDPAQAIGGMVVVVGLLLFVIEFVFAWWRRPR